MKAAYRLDVAGDAQVIHVKDAEAGKTLAGIVRLRNRGMSWGEANRRVKKRYVEVNGNLACDPARRLNPGEVIKHHGQPRQPLPDLDDLSIVYRDDDIVIVDKPARVTSVRHREERGKSKKRKQLQPTLDEMLQSLIDVEWHAEHGDKTAKPVPRGKATRYARGREPEGPPKVRAVHRLDRDTSGLMVFVLNPAAERDLIEQFRKHTIEREYLAIVHGHPEKMTIQSHLVRDRGDGKRGSLRATVSPTTDKSARHAVTHVTPLEPLGEDFHLVRCKLETGRTHQIRIHLSEKGFPLVGDKLYGDHRGGAPRHVLHAFRLGLLQPRTGDLLRHEAPWPDDLRSWEKANPGRPLRPNRLAHGRLPADNVVDGPDRDTQR